MSADSKVQRVQALEQARKSVTVTSGAVEAAAAATAGRKDTLRVQSDVSKMRCYHKPPEQAPPGTAVTNTSEKKHILLLLLTPSYFLLSLPSR